MNYFIIYLLFCLEHPAQSHQPVEMVTGSNISERAPETVLHMVGLEEQLQKEVLIKFLP